MRIVHYTLGIYPLRTGGLNRYATDLMMEQNKEHKVSVLLPGTWIPWKKKCFISYNSNYSEIKCYHLNNALPQPLFYGIRKPKNLMGCPICLKSFEKFFTEEKPEVLHLHTLMGMPEEALRFFKDKGVKIVYTSHDYFGICPKVNLINQNGVLCEGPAPGRCAICNENSLSTLFLRVRNSEVAFKTRNFTRWLKNTLNF